MVLVDMWKRLSHTNIVQLKEVFTTKVFGDNCKFFREVDFFKELYESNIKFE